MLGVTDKPTTTSRSTTMPTSTSTPTSTANPNECPICGIWSDTGKRSCCAIGGSWVRQCGRRSKGFRYSWADGVRACEDTGGRKDKNPGLRSRANVTKQPYAAQRLGPLQPPNNESFRIVSDTGSTEIHNTLLNAMIIGGLFCAVFSK